MLTIIYFCLLLIYVNVLSMCLHIPLLSVFLIHKVVSYVALTFLLLELHLLVWVSQTIVSLLYYLFPGFFSFCISLFFSLMSVFPFFFCFYLRICYWMVDVKMEIITATQTFHTAALNKSVNVQCYRGFLFYGILLSFEDLLHSSLPSSINYRTSYLSSRRTGPMFVHFPLWN